MSKVRFRVLLNLRKSQHAEGRFVRKTLIEQPFLEFYEIIADFFQCRARNLNKSCMLCVLVNSIFEKNILTV